MWSGNFHLGLALIVLQLQATRLVSADFVPADPRGTCSSFGVSSGVSCPAPQTGCCYGACCAGGCCPLTAVCLNIGLSNEGCCPIGDPTNCGAPIPSTVGPFCSVCLFFCPRTISQPSQRADLLPFSPVAILCLRNTDLQLPRRRRLDLPGSQRMRRPQRCLLRYRPHQEMLARGNRRGHGGGLQD